MEKVSAFITDKTIEIDTKYDLQLAKNNQILVKKYELFEFIDTLY